MVSNVNEWRWRSYKSTANAGKVPQYLTIEWVLEQFSEQKNAARQRYRTFVAEDLVDRARPWQKLTGQVFLGSENFVSRISELLGDKQEITEIPRAQRYPGRPHQNNIPATAPVRQVAIVPAITDGMPYRMTRRFIIAGFPDTWTS